jgi:hypothetical protein
VRHGLLLKVEGDAPQRGSEQEDEIGLKTSHLTC